jgi:tetraacyldisaccharide 4'-kinase
LHSARIKVIPHVFPDHHKYKAADFANMDKSLPILMTEKDAVKCRNLGLKNAWFLSVDAVLPADWERDLVRRVVQGSEKTEKRS